MVMRGSVQRLATRPVIDKLFNVLQSSSQDERQMKLGNFIDTYLQHRETVYPNLLNNIIHRLAIEQPTNQALWACETQTNESQKLTFNDVHTQSSRLANVLTGKEFNLTPGKSVC